MPSDIQGEPLTLPGPSVDSRREAKLLVQEARDYIAEVPAPKEGEQRAESKRRIRNYTGERLLREEPRRYRLIASMRCEGLGIRQTCRAAHCDARTVASVERHANQPVTTAKPKLVRGFGELARMTLERLQEEVPTMNQAQLAVTAGIATDKFLTLSGEANQRIDVNINDNRGNIFERMAELAQTMTKTVQAKVIEPEPLQLQEQT